MIYFEQLLKVSGSVLKNKLIFKVVSLGLAPFVASFIDASTLFNNGNF